VTYDHTVNERYGFQIGVSTLLNDDFIDDPAVVGTPNDDPLRAWGQFAVRW
jgi:hypothetical protein